MGNVRSWFVLNDSAGTDRFWRVLRDPGGTDQRYVKTLPNPLVPSRIHQDPPESMNNPQDQSVLSRTKRTYQEIQVPIRTNQNPLGPSIVNKDLYVKIFNRNRTFNFRLSSCFISYLGQIVTSDIFLWTIFYREFKGHSKMSLLFIQSVKGA